ncbi:hypothetical protein MMC25_005729 [Agyrium rufum]|nr:hypothetical protein [Agyrium rufum]
MKLSLLVAGILLGLANAQDFNVKAIAKAPPTFVTVPVDVLGQTATYAPLPTLVSSDTASDSQRKQRSKRDGTCETYPAGSGPVPIPDTVSAFLADPDLQATATNAPTPGGYTQVFSNLQGSLSASMYMGLYTLTSFDTVSCALYCDQAAGCVAINMYIERDPSVDPNAQDCPNPPSITNFKCTLWGAPISAGEATNTGQWRDSFQVVITGSNGYSKVAPPAIPGFFGPVDLGGAINAPLLSNGVNTSVGFLFYPFSQDQGYTPTTCASACLALNNPAPGSPIICAFFDAFVVSENGIPQGMYCSLYNAPWPASYGTNTGQTSGQNRYTVSQSYSYSILLSLIQDPDFSEVDTFNNEFGPWYAYTYRRGYVSGGVVGFAPPGFSSVELTQGPFQLTASVPTVIQITYSLYGDTSGCSVYGGIDNGNVPWDGTSGTKTTTFTSDSSVGQNFTLNVGCTDASASIGIQNILLGGVG